MSRSKWFDGFLYAEEVFKILGPYEAPSTLEGDIIEFSEFDRGILDYVKLMYHLELHNDRPRNAGMGSYR
jgi:hypothetical protein